jgi:hypothetical protein
VRGIVGIGRVCMSAMGSHVCMFTWGIMFSRVRIIAGNSMHRRCTTAAVTLHRPCAEWTFDLPRRLFGPPRTLIDHELEKHTWPIGLRCLSPDAEF